MATRTTPSTTKRRRTQDEEQPSIEVVNSATGAVVGSVPQLDAAQVAVLVERARAAQPAWAARGVRGRVTVLQRFRRRLVEHKRLVIETLQAESGKTWEDCNADVLLVASWAQQLCQFGPAWLADEQPKGSGIFTLGRRNTIQHEPLGVVGVIGPWNVPLSLTVGDALPALLAGNTVVIKPSEVTPLSAGVAQKLWLESGGPADVLLVATGTGDAGAALVDHVDAIHFTGSVATGRRVAVRAAERLIPATLELGGNDAMIVLEDADLDRAAAAAAHYSMFNSGQVCMSVERVYVQDRVHDLFVDKLVGEIGRLQQGVPAGPGTADLTAPIHPPQLDTVAAHVADAVSKGARVAYGGRTTTGPGRFHQPTVLVDVDHTMTAMCDETFGPTVPVMRVRDAEEAIALANDSRYGLTASIWTGDAERGEELARRLEVGTVTVNDAMFHLGDVTLPMGGWKDSGLGVRNGRQGVLQYTRTRVVQVASTVGSRDVSWMPYSTRVTERLSTVYDAILGRPNLPQLPTVHVPGPGDVVRGTTKLVRSVVGR